MKSGLFLWSTHGNGLQCWFLTHANFHNNRETYRQTEWNSFLYLFASSGFLHLMAHNFFNVHLVASAPAAAVSSSGYNNHNKIMIGFSGMQGGEKSMNEKKSARGHATAQFILALNSIRQPNCNREGTETRQKIVFSPAHTRMTPW